MKASTTPTAKKQHASTFPGAAFAEATAQSRRGSAETAEPETPSPRRGSMQKMKTVDNFENWFAEKRRQSTEQQQHAEIAQEKKRINQESNQVDGTTRMWKNNKRFMKRIVRDVAEVRRTFYLFDEERTGRIEPRDFVLLMSKLMKQTLSDVDRQEVWKNWDNLDQDGRGWVTYEEFEPWYCQTFEIALVPDLRSFINEDLLPEDQREIRRVAKKLEISEVEVEKIWKEFKKVDSDGSGEVEWDEFVALIKQQLANGPNAPEVPMKVLKKFWMDVDVDGSGSITFEEFAAWYAKYLFSDISPMESYYNTLGRGLRSTVLDMMKG